ncbi:MAG: hypothetical protein WBM75_18805 [Polyangiales bacterium]|jgi:hypothetical protein
MRYLFGVLCVCALGAMPLVGCSDGGSGACADWAGEWTLGSVSCDDVAETAPDIEYSFAANCTGEMIISDSATCESTVQITFTPEAGDTTFDLGAVTCSAGCTEDRCQATDSWGQPFTSTISRSDDTLTIASLVTVQMVSDEVTPCQVGKTQVSVLVAK